MANKNITSTVINPNASITVYNYDSRLVTTDHGDPTGVSGALSAISGLVSAVAGSPAQVTQTTNYIPNTSIVGIRTSKQKSSPAGSFEFYLAPTGNWLGTITPGSWCVIVMSRSKLPSSLSVGGLSLQAPDKKTLKMVGRIESVRLTYSVNAQTGAKQSMYVVTGQDWGSVFESMLYIDTLARNPTLTAPGEAESIVFSKYLSSYHTEQGLISTDNIADAIIDIWGAPLDSFSELLKSVVLKSRLFQIPSQLALFLNFGAIAFPTQDFGKLINRSFGVIQSDGSYSRVTDSFMKVDPAKFFGQHTFWQLLTEHCNTIINELVAEIDWADESTPQLTLFKRIKPFALRDDFEGSGSVQDLTAMFSDVPRINIPLSEITEFNAGNNWRDKMNFVETLPSDDSQYASYAVDAKIDSQAFDELSFNRDGFKPLLARFNAYPAEGSSLGGGGLDINPKQLTKFKFLLKEWYFNTHNMLNGSMTFVGQDDYIQVGQNIIIDAQILGESFNFNKAIKSKAGSGSISSAIGSVSNAIGALTSVASGSKGPVLPANKAYLLVHVESVANSFSVDGAGARSFTTTVTFTRGVITDNNGLILDEDSIGGMDKKASDLPTSDRNNRANIFITKV